MRTIHLGTLASAIVPEKDGDSGGSRAGEVAWAGKNIVAKKAQTRLESSGQK
jgi:hypothetical protein